MGRMIQLGSIAALISSSSLISTAAAETICEREMAAAAAAQNIPLSILYSVGLTETGARGQLNPYDMNIDGETVHSPNLTVAMEKYREARARGAALIDVGCMQINVRWHGTKFSSVEEMFDPRKNVHYAARFLQELRGRHKTWTLAVARYNAGPDNNGAQQRYVCTVVRQLVKSGMGGWTDSARQFCGAPPKVSEFARENPAPKAIERISQSTGGSTRAVPSGPAKQPTPLYSSVARTYPAQTYGRPASLYSRTPDRNARSALAPDSR